MKRRVTRWVTDRDVADALNRDCVMNVDWPLATFQKREGFPVCVTIEYEDGKPAPQPATRERVVEGFISKGDMDGTCQDPTKRLLSLKENWCYTIPARLIITKPVPEMTLIEAVDKPVSAGRMPYNAEWDAIVRAAARERAKVGK